MKRFLILTSVLALTACAGSGGGSAPATGGATAGTPAPDRPNITEDSFPRETGISNSKVTSMISQIFIPKNNTNTSYNMYTLQDVKFISGDDAPSASEYVTFGINEETGVIDELHIYDDAEKIILTRQNDGNKFTVPGYTYQISYLQDGAPQVWESDIVINKITDPKMLRNQITNDMNDKNIPTETQQLILANIDKGTWANHTLTDTVQLFGKYVGERGLHHADFGRITTSVGAKVIDNDIIAGGYEIRRITNDKIVNHTATFHGTAVANIGYTDEKNGRQTTEIDTQKGATTLKVVNGTETLTMPFDDYYTVVVEKNGTDANVTFKDWSDKQDAKYKFAEESFKTNDIHFQYFGENDIPSEAVGIIEHDEDSQYKPSFDAGFGVQVR